MRSPTPNQGHAIFTQNLWPVEVYCLLLDGILNTVRGGQLFNKKSGKPMCTILVEMAQAEWTMQAMHLACALARNMDAKVALLRLVQVEHLSYLGTAFGNRPPDDQEYRNLQELAATAEDYDVELTVFSKQCFSPLDAIAEAANHLNASLVFAQVPDSRIPYRRKVQIWTLKRQLWGRNRQLFTLDQLPGTIEWVPFVTVKAIASVD